MGLPLAKKEHYTPEEYFDICESAEFGYEYEQGRILAMGVTSEPHNDLVFNLTSILKKATSDRKCKVHFETLPLEVEKDGKYYLPDVMLSCDSRDSKNPKIKRFPSLVIEVLSPGSEARDRGAKFHAYMKISSLKFYMLVSQDSLKVEVFAKTNKGGWEYAMYERAEQEIALSEIEISLFVRDIYEAVEFPLA